jgi:hypothetical protein
MNEPSEKRARHKTQETKMNSTISDVFSNNEKITFVITEAGHGYAKAKYSSTCKLTGIEIYSGEPVRKIKIQTRSGLTWSGYTSNRIYCFLTKSEVARYNLQPLDFNPDMDLIGWTKFAQGWEDNIAKELNTATEGTKLKFVNKRGEEKTYSYNKWTGKFRLSGTYSDCTAKQVIAALKRSKTKRLYILHREEWRAEW